jgi:hypothetical protein
MIDMGGKHVLIQVKVEAFPRNKAIQVTQTCDAFPVLVQVTGTPWSPAKLEMPCRRTGMDIVVALNVKMHEVKEAVMTLVDRLSPNDRLSILFQGRVYQQMELTYMSDYGRDVARRTISEIAQRNVDENDAFPGPVLQQAAEVHPRAFQ